MRETDRCDGDTVHTNKGKPQMATSPADKMYAVTQHPPHISFSLVALFYYVAPQGLH